jgi:hypothetical protein
MVTTYPEGVNEQRLLQNTTRLIDTKLPLAAVFNAIGWVSSAVGRGFRSPMLRPGELSRGLQHRP